MAGIVLGLSAHVAAAEPALDRASQIVVVVPDDDGWAVKRAKLRRYERRDGAWVPVGEVVPVALGAGLGWGRGVVTFKPGADEPIKKEGDKRSPAGVFALPSVTGTVPSLASGLPYREATDKLRCVDDGKSPQYNTVTDEGSWTSAEEMRADHYAIAVFVAHNPDRKPGAGSCIFLHVGDHTTVGCTVMSRPALAEIVAWLQPGALLVQLPRQVYRREKPRLGLP